MHIAYVAGVPGQDKGSKTGEELDGAKQDKHHCLRACQVHPPGGEGQDDHDDWDDRGDGRRISDSHCNQGIFLHLN